MACGLGAVALMFVFVKESTFNPLNTDFSNEVTIINKEISLINDQIDKKNTELENILTEIKSSDELINDSYKKIEVTNMTIDDLVNKNDQLSDLLNKINNNIPNKSSVEKKEYISGCNVKGQKIIFLIDTSKSMLDKEVINILQLGVKPLSEQNKSKKWIQTKNTLRWLINNTPNESEILISSFNENLNYDVNDGDWTNKNDLIAIESQIINLFTEPPSGGTNLQNAIKMLNPWNDADSIYLVTDGLPTLAMQPKNSIDKVARCLNDDYVSGDCRLIFFNEFKKELMQFKKNVVLNTILLPMKGDPDAPYHFSYLSTNLNGCFMTPSRVWPL
jgi:hypothetical protein